VKKYSYDINKFNFANKCRVSVDFRVIKKSNYIDSNHTSINTKTKFGIGGYYTLTRF